MQDLDTCLICNKHYPIDELEDWECSKCRSFDKGYSHYDPELSNTWNVESCVHCGKYFGINIQSENICPECG